MYDKNIVEGFCRSLKVGGINPNVFFDLNGYGNKQFLRLPSFVGINVCGYSYTCKIKCETTSSLDICYELHLLSIEEYMECGKDFLVLNIFGIDNNPTNTCLMIYYTAIRVSADE